MRASLRGALRNSSRLCDAVVHSLQAEDLDTRDKASRALEQILDALTLSLTLTLTLALTLTLTLTRSAGSTTCATSRSASCSATYAGCAPSRPRRSPACARTPTSCSR